MVGTPAPWGALAGVVMLLVSGCVSNLEPLAAPEGMERSRRLPVDAPPAAPADPPLEDLAPAARQALRKAEPARAIPDPLLRGPLGVLRHDYDLGDVLPVPGTGHTDSLPMQPMERRGSVHIPVGGTGPYPLVVFLHGRHGTCELIAFGEALPPACPAVPLPEPLPPVAEPVNSYAGYDAWAELLASHGYVVVSASANRVNERDGLSGSIPLPNGPTIRTGDSGARARAEVVLATLDAFVAMGREPGPEPVGDDLVGLVDPGRIGLMGHSRGGEGVARAVLLNAERPEGARHAIGAVFALAPTDFGRWVPEGPAFATLLPYCDGDVFNLMGAWMYDDLRYAPNATGAQYQFLLMGANHNWFNTVWTGDDGYWRDDPHCARGRGPQGPQGGRLGPEEQQALGGALLAGFFRLHLGGEESFRPMLAGAAPLPPSACPARSRGWCPDAVHVAYQAEPGRRLVVEDALDESAFERNDLGGASSFQGFDVLETCRPPGCPAKPTRSTAPQLVLGWLGPAGAWFEVPAEHQDLSPWDAVTFRAAVVADEPRNPRGLAQQLRVALTDADGVREAVAVGEHSTALFYPPGDDARKATLNTAVVPLWAFRQVDLGRVVALELAFDQSRAGVLQVADVMFQVTG